MKWQKIVCEIGGQSTMFQLNSSIRETSIIKSEFKIELPQELIDFYRETNGICETINGESIGDLIWSVERLIHENKECRTSQVFKELYMPFDCLLFISDAGNGDNFGYSIQENSIRRTDIYAWNHEDDSRIWVAPNLETFVKWWTSGKIKL